MSILIRNWWVLVLRGALAVIFGILAFVWPGATILTFVLLYGVYALVDGIFSLAAAIRPAPGQSRGWLILGGILGVVAGIVVLAMPGLSAIVLFYIVAFWAILTGITQIAMAIALRKVITGEWMLVLAGVLAIILALFMISRPAAGLIGLTWAIGAYAIIFGILLIFLGFRLRSWSTDGAGSGRRPMASA